MKGTSIFNFKAWSAIHPPLPRTPRQSKQLLNALTSSFRRQLDQEYPLHSSDRPENNNNHAEGDKKPINTNSSAHATDIHLKAILDNPLFRVVPSRGAAVSHHHHHHDQSCSRPAEEQKRKATEPMIAFDNLAASGSVTPAAACDCLKSQLLLASAAGSAGMNKAMKDSKAGSKVAAWFWASDSTARKSLFGFRTLTASLLKFMAAEGLQDTVVDWLQMLLRHDVGGGDGNGQLSEVFAQSTFNLFLADFMTAEVQYGNGLNSAMKYYLQAYSMHLSLGIQSSDRLKKTLLLSSARLLKSTMDNSQGQAKEISAPVYDRFNTTVSVLLPHSVLAVSIPVYHPTHPDTAPVLKFVEAHPKLLRLRREYKREILLRVCYDAIHILNEREQSRQASRLAQFVQGLLRNEDSSEATITTTSSSSPSSSSLRKDHSSSEEDYLLSRLDLALA